MKFKKNSLLKTVTVDSVPRGTTRTCRSCILSQNFARRTTTKQNNSFYEPEFILVHVCERNNGQCRLFSEENSGKNLVEETTARREADRESIAGHQIGLPATAAAAAAATAVDVNASVLSSSSADVELTSSQLSNIVRSANVRRSQRQQLACQHEVSIMVHLAGLCSCPF